MTNIANIRPDSPTVAIEGQATGETPVNIRPDGWTAPRRSNYDNMKTMTVEQMAEFLGSIIQEWHGATAYANVNGKQVLIRGWLSWLKSDAVK